MLIVDTHTYAVAEDRRFPLVAAPAAWVRGAVPIERLLAMLDAAGVAKATLLQALQAHGYDNAYTMDCALRYPERLVAIGMYDPLAAGESERLRLEVERGRVRGARIVPSGLEEPAALASWRAAEELAIPMLIAVSRPDHYAAVRRLARRFPAVAVVMEGAGLESEVFEGPPFEKQAPLFELAAEKNIYLKWSTDQLAALGSLEWRRQFIGRLIECFGAERVMWGSRYPYRQEPEWTYASMVGAALETMAAFGERERRLVMGEAALRLWPDLAG